MSQAAKLNLQPSTTEVLNLGVIEATPASNAPYPHIIASGVLPESLQQALKDDFPNIDKPGFFPLNMLEQKGAFAALIRDVQSEAYSALVGQKLGLELRDKPQMITIRKWSEIKAGRIHNDSESKICTSLIYLNDEWHDSADGKLRVLHNEKNFEDYTAEISPVYGSFFAFKRTENSWHGHKPFEGERRVVQITWLRSIEDLERKEKRGNMSYFIKKLFGGRNNY